MLRYRDVCQRNGTSLVYTVNVWRSVHVQVPVDPRLVPEVDAVRDDAEEHHHAGGEEPADAGCCRVAAVRTPPGSTSSTGGQRRRGSAGPTAGASGIAGVVCGSPTPAATSQKLRDARASQQTRRRPRPSRRSGVGQSSSCTARLPTAKSHADREQVEPPRQPELELADAAVGEAGAEHERLPRDRRERRGSRCRRARGGADLPGVAARRRGETRNAQIGTNT